MHIGEASPIVTININNTSCHNYGKQQRGTAGANGVSPGFQGSLAQLAEKQQDLYIFGSGIKDLGNGLIRSSGSVECFGTRSPYKRTEGVRGHAKAWEKSIRSHDDDDDDDEMAHQKGEREGDKNRQLSMETKSNDYNFGEIMNFHSSYC